MDALRVCLYVGSALVMGVTGLVFGSRMFVGLCPPFPPGRSTF
jgi:hypothetical protein